MREKNFNLIGLPGPMEDFCSDIGWMILRIGILCTILAVIKKIRGSKREEKKEENNE